MDELRAKLASLRIEVLIGDNGELTAFSKNEPSFCFVRQDENALKAVVENTLRSYAKTFFNQDVIINVQPARGASSPRTVRLTPRNTLRPVFGNEIGNFATA